MFWSILIENTVMAGGLAVVVAVVCRFNRARPALCHMLWLLVFAVLVMPPLPIGGAGLRSSVSSLLSPSVESTAPTYVAPAWGGKTLGATWEFEDSAAVSFAAVSDAPEVWVDDHELAALTLELEPAGWYATVSSKTWFLAVWALGAFGILAWMQRRITRFHRGVRAAKPAPMELVNEVEAVAHKLGVTAPEVRMLEGVGSPSVWCFGRPRLLWPTKNGVMAERALAPSLIAHELAHIARRDTWVSRLEVLALATCWWHPLFWLIRRQVHTYAEQSCDAWALWAYPKQRLVFAEALIGAHDDTLTAPVALQGLCATNSDFKDFERRLKMILNEKVTRGVSKTAAALAIATTVMILPGESQEPNAVVSGEVVEQCEGCESDTAHICVDSAADAQELADEAERLFGEGMLPEAMDVFESALALDPDHNGAHARLAYIQIGMRMLDEARGHLEHAMENGSNVQIAAYNLACCDALEGKTDSGLQYLAKSIRNGFADGNLLATDTDIDNLRGARAFDAAVGLVDISNQLRASLASEGEGDADQQLSKLYSLTRIASEDGQLASEYAMAIHNSGDYKSSLAAFERQAKLGHNVPTALYNRGCALARLGQTEAAMTALFEAAEKGMSYPQAKVDADLESLHSHPRWDDALEALSAQQTLTKAVELAALASESALAVARAHQEQDTQELRAALTAGLEDEKHLKFVLQRAKAEGQAAAGVALSQRDAKQNLEIAEREYVVRLQRDAELQVRESLDYAMLESELVEEAMLAYTEALEVAASADEYVRLFEQEVTKDGELAEHYRLVIEGAAGAERAALLLSSDENLRAYHDLGELAELEEEGYIIRWLEPDTKETQRASIRLEGSATGGTKVVTAPVHLGEETHTIHHETKAVHEISAPFGIDDLTGLNKPHKIHELSGTRKPHTIHELPEMTESHEVRVVRGGLEPNAARDIREAIDAVGIATDRTVSEAKTRSVEAKDKATAIKLQLEQRHLEMRKLEVELEIRRVELESLQRKLEIENLELELKKLEKETKAAASKSTKKAS
jgi:beta-lactamase regulating signal transducer with metallopeptidase domain/Flp pilus assembly protein TadD